MSKISVNIESLEEKIQKIRDLKDSLDSIDVSTETLSGSGQSIEILTLIDQEYPLLKASVMSLLANSISFFENTKNSIIEADKEASAEIK